jgi:hypothetical protein
MGHRPHEDQEDAVDEVASTEKPEGLVEQRSEITEPDPESGDVHAATIGRNIQRFAVNAAFRLDACHDYPRFVG